MVAFEKGKPRLREQSGFQKWGFGATLTSFTMKRDRAKELLRKSAPPLLLDFLEGVPKAVGFLLTIHLLRSLAKGRAGCAASCFLGTGK